MSQRKNMGTRMKKMIKNCLLPGYVLLLTACGASNPPDLSEGHLGVDAEVADSIPAPVTDAPVLPEPEQRPNLETYTVVVNQVPVRELLFSMARDAKLNLDIDTDLKGKVTMNAIDQTLPQILERLANQAAINYSLEGDTLHIRADNPYLHLYNVNYLNMARLSKGSVEVATEISSTGTSEGGGSAGNNSSSVVENVSNNEFWKTLVVNIGGVIGEEVKASKDGIASSNNIIVNRETGVIGVRATFRQHKQIQSLLDRVVGSAQRQVMIEATIAEVTLSDHYQAGIDWSAIRVDGLGNITDSASQSLLGGNLGTTPFFQITGSKTNSSGDQLTGTLKALETFGDVKVLSSPKVMAINNQTAMLKVVDSEVYFLIDVEKGTILDGLLTPGTITTNIHTVPVGFVMSVMPYVDENDVVTLHVRPTISRIIGRAVDPNPALAEQGIVNEVPIIQVREIESVLKVNNGDTAVIGGLMQDQINKQQSGVPILSSIPLIGALFSYQDDEYVKSELVIFIRPVVVHEASLDGDLKEYKKYLMDDFDATPPKPE
ncbi:MAG: pilus (MSHA type) biogenesis protein MshL [Gammaproteobacteria bacterium]|nr:pilus (MSHA type) biogenesis protein MshL [Gammaproteobacteria bacterium]